MFFAIISWFKRLSIYAFLWESSILQYADPQCGNKQVIVHLFEWPWNAIAYECETVLGPLGYCAVQVSPPNEHIQGDTWWTRYQPVSYNLTSRSGNPDEFASMVARCNAVGVNVIADMVINHMSAHGNIGTGTAGNVYVGDTWNYPAVPYSTLDFHHPYCEILNYNDASEVRNCYLVTLNDLDGSKIYVRYKIAEYANELLRIGVKGFRIDAAKHMWPQDLEAIQDLWDDTIDGRRPFVFHEVIDHCGGCEAVTLSEYLSLGKATEFRASDYFTCIRQGDFDCLFLYPLGLIDGLHALTFVDNHDSQRGGGALTYKEDYNYKMATAFHLAHEYGFKRVMSSYAFDDNDQGPPITNPCGIGWVCEHRWSSIGNLVQFANAVVGEPVLNWQHKKGCLGFSRGNKGFIAMGSSLDRVEFYTGIPDGEYCDIIHDCAQTISVVGSLAIVSKYQDNDPVVAICVGCTGHGVLNPDVTLVHG